MVEKFVRGASSAHQNAHNARDIRRSESCRVHTQDTPRTGIIKAGTRVPEVRICVISMQGFLGAHNILVHIICILMFRGHLYIPVFATLERRFSEGWKIDKDRQRSLSTRKAFRKVG